MAEQWPTLTLYQRFESGVALALTVITAVIILMALFQLTADVFGYLMVWRANPLEYRFFQILFGQILTVLIALEFNHTLLYVVNREQSIIQTKVVLLIALLALARRFIILDLSETPSSELLAMAAVTLALGITYWLMRERDDLKVKLEGSSGTPRERQGPA